MVIRLSRPNSRSLWDPFPEDSPAQLHVCLPAIADYGHVTLVGPAMGSSHVTGAQDMGHCLLVLLVLSQLTAFIGALSKLCAMKSTDLSEEKIQVQFLALLLTNLEQVSDPK